MANKQQIRDGSMKNVAGLSTGYKSPAYKQLWIASWISVGMLIIATIFVYWYAWRPHAVRQECHNKAFEQRVESLSKAKQTVEHETLYQLCIRSHGLEK